MDDLYSLMKDQPKEYHSDMPHFYTQEGTEVITNQVVSCIEKELGIKANKLDYKELFKNNEQVIGI